MSTLQVATILSTTANTPPLFQDVAGTQIGTLCRAWVSADTTVTPIVINGSFNVSSITDNGVGDITINMTNAMPDTNYAAFATALSPSNAAWTYAFGTKTTSASRFKFTQLSGGAVTTIDSTSFCVAIFR